MINSKGYWEGLEAESQHIFDPKLCNELVSFFQKELKTNGTMADLGCGMGDYVKELNKNNINCVGYDGNPNTEELTDDYGKVLDLADKIEINVYDWILSLEVGEHIPKEYESIFIDNIHRHNKKGIILSWAVKGQGGHGHFNEQNNIYIKKIFRKLGYINNRKIEKHLRDAASLPWFRNTIMVFRKK